MYVIDQNAFLNAACLLETSLTSMQLLDALKDIEMELGRQATFKNGPRIIDLDILMYADQVVKEDRLEIPHPRIAERSFVLKPLCDINPNLIHPVKKMSMVSMLNTLSPDNLKDLHSVIPFGKDHDDNYVFRNIEERPIIMGILNVTPDSFSDGGENFTLQDAVKSGEKMLQQGADILDIGGESTRPGAMEIEIREEIRRVVPIIEAIKKIHPTCVISIDTRKADVAKASLIAGADIVNDVSGGCFDSNMFTLVSSFQCPMIIMHSRGTPQTMQQLADYDEGKVTAIVQQELHDILNIADTQIPRWLQIIDLGIGFAKSFEHNMSLLKPENMRSMKASLGNRTMLVGPSRKRFIGTLLNKYSAISGKKIETTVEDKDWGTAGACCASILGGANILRVHHVEGVKHACDVFHSCTSATPRLPRSS